jgi:protein O-GlcNAc transferase
MNHTGRNDPCPCGSGLKFKKCCLDRARQDTPFDDQTASHRAHGFKEMSLENWDVAIDHFKACLDSDPNQYEIVQAIASCYDGLEDFLLAAEYYEKALTLAPSPRHFDLYYSLGVSRGCAERIGKAAEAFRTCQDLPGHDEKKATIRSILLMLDEILQGKQMPSLFMVQTQLQRAFSDMDAERYQSAADRLEHISRIDPDNAAIFYNLGVVYTYLGREDVALGNFGRCLDINPLYAHAWYNMGQIHLIRRKDYSMARQCFERAVAIRPDYIGAHHQGGVACEQLGDREGALKGWRRTLELDPENSLAKDNIQRLQASASENPSGSGDSKGM